MYVDAVVTHPLFCFIGGLSAGETVGITVSVIAVVLLLVAVIAVLVGLLIYGYTHPTSSIGLFMIEVCLCVCLCVSQCSN